MDGCCDDGGGGRKVNKWVLPPIETGVIPRQLVTPKVGYGYSIYEYSSKPNKISGIYLKNRPKYRFGVKKPRGAHDYYNVMWDPHVYRGSNYKTFQQFELERKLNLKRSKRCSSKEYKKSPYRFEIPKIPATPRKRPVENYELNLDAYLIEQTLPPCKAEKGTQIDLINPKERDPSALPISIGYETSTEMLDSEIFKFDEEVQPIVDVIGTKLLEQSVIECEQEEELMQLQSEQHGSSEKRKEEELRLCRLEQRMCYEHNQRKAMMEIYAKKKYHEEAMERLVGCRMFSKSYLKEMMPQVLESLKSDGYFQCRNVEHIQEWLNEKVEEDVGQYYLAEDLLSDMLENLVLGRDMEYKLGQKLELDPYEYPGEDWNEEIRYNSAAEEEE